MGKHAYLIMAHNQWECLFELLKALDDPRNDIFLHIYKKASSPQHRDILNQVSESKLYFTKPFNIVWGGTQILRCTLNMLEQAVSGGERYDYYHFISGVDYPLRSQDEIHAYFSSCGEQQFVAYDWNGIRTGAFVDRMRFYHLFANRLGKPGGMSAYTRVVSKLENFLLGIQRKLKVDRIQYDFYKGSAWFSITHTAASAIIAEKKRIVRRYRFTLASDESWLQIFMKESVFSGKIADSNLRYIKLVQGKASPETLTTADYENMVDSEKFFARKFDWNIDHDIISKLKTHINGDHANEFQIQDNTVYPNI